MNAQRIPAAWSLFAVSITFLSASPAGAAGEEERAAIEITESAEGLLFTEGGRPVLFYQRAPKSLDGKFTRANYVHPLYGLDGAVLTEDFPPDHRHHRGIFWAWHQLWIGERRGGDSWEPRDFTWDIRAVEALPPESGSRSARIRVVWMAPEPVVEELALIRVHRSADGIRLIDFDISLLGLVDGVRIGGSEDEKGYGGFTTRIRLAADVAFKDGAGAIEPRNLAIEAGSWIDVAGSLGKGGGKAGLAILCHPSTPGFPRRWILRRSGSAQNHAFPGSETVPLSRTQPLTLRYRLAVHLGDLDTARIESLMAEYARTGAPPAVEPLAGTAPLEGLEADISGRLMDGAHRFVERQIAASIGKRAALWKRDLSSPASYLESVEPNRERFRRLIGAVDPRLPPGMEEFGDEENPALVAETDSYTIHRVRWPALEGVSGEGLLARQRRAPVGRVVAIPDAGATPEDLLGLAGGVEPERQFARRLAENGFEVIVPALIDRRKLETSDPRLLRSDQTHREWIYRQAFHMGRHIIGYEVEKVLAAVDWLARRSGGGGKIGVAGYAEGGLIAFYAAAIDTRLDAALVSGYFDSRQAVWSEPIYRNVWGLLREFGDAELASLVAPRGLVIEYAPVPAVSGQKGELETPPVERVEAELDRIPAGAFLPRPALVRGEGGEAIGPGSPAAIRAFAARLGVESAMPLADHPPADRRRSFPAAARHARQLKELERRVQDLVRESEHIRDRFFLHAVMPELAEARWSTERRHPVHKPEKFIDGARRYRELFQEEGMGRFDEPMLPANPRTRKIIEAPGWMAYDVVLDVYRDLIAWGVLVLPRDLRPGERRPVVVCQHGRNGLPRDTIDGNTSAYNNFAAALAERGFITFAPHNLYRGEDRYRWLDRKANSVRASLFSFIIAQHDQILRWLRALPFVDGERIAFYGLSYGGETAMRVPAILEGYCLSICSGDFNQWTRKVASTDQPFSFMSTIEWEMPYWNLGQTFDYAEMAYLIFPRPFMVERGHLDLVGRDQWVAHEYAKVRWLYAQLGLADRTEIEFFQGGHSINGEGTFEFLHRHLRWPRPQTPRKEEDR